MNNSIYILKCPMSGFIRYVGISNNPTRRMYEHKRRDTNTHKSNWIEKLKSKGLMPRLEILEEGLTRALAAKKEQMFISLFKAIGYKLVNVSKGGEMPPSQKGRKVSVQTRKLMLKSAPLKKTVYQFTKDGLPVCFYASVREAFRITGVDHRSIAEVANGSNPKRHSAGGFIWKYKK